METSIEIPEEERANFEVSVRDGQAAPVEVSEDRNTTYNNDFLQPSSPYSQPEHYHRSLEVVDLERCDFSTAHVMYFMAFISNHQLQTLNLTILTTFYNWIERNSEDIYNYAIRHVLGTRQNVNIYMCHRNNFRATTSSQEDRRIITLKEEVGKYWNFVDRIKASRSISARSVYF